jgi:DNA modification methylase
MPILTWPTKSLPDLDPARLTTESIIYPRGLGYPDAVPENQLILGDNLPVMASLLPEYEGRLDLIYADPPFFTNKRYSARIGRGEDSRRPEEWKLAEGYADHWSDMDAYLDFLYPRLALMFRLLAPQGTLYLHLDWHADACARLILDELFGRDRFLNEIIWTYHGPSPIRSAFNRKHDTILVYTKSSDYIFNVDAVREPYNPNTVKTFASSKKAGFGKVPDLERGKVPEDWWYFPVVARLHNERTGYPPKNPKPCSSASCWHLPTRAEWLPISSVARAHSHSLPRGTDAASSAAMQPGAPSTPRASACLMRISLSRFK